MRVEMRVRPIPERLRWLAEHLHEEGHKPGVIAGVAFGLMCIAEELERDGWEASDGG